MYCAGIEIIPVDGATGFMDTDYSAKVEAAFTALRKLDLVYLQVTAPERPSMQGLIEDKVLAVEDFDREVVGPILERIIGQNDVRILLVVNQFCSANSMKMTRDAVPFVVYPSRNGPDDIERFDEEIIKGKLLGNITPIIDNIRMIKSDEELKIARHAGEVAMAMMDGAKSVIGHNVPEYEIALAQAEAGTRKAAELLKSHYPNSPNMSPNIHFLAAISSGKDLPKTHHRASTKLVKKGDPIFCCYCGSTNFHRFKLGFDRVFWVEEIKHKDQIKAFEVAVKSQKAALDVLGPGITAEEVHAAYADTVQSEGYPYPTFRCGRGTGFSFLEEPQLVVGNKTVLQPGMVFAVDGGASAKDFRSQVGDSFIITEDGYEQITHHSKEIEDLIIN